MYFVPHSPIGKTPAATASAGSPEAAFLLHERKLACENTVFSVYLDHLEQPGDMQVFDYISLIPKVAMKDGVSGVAVLPQLDGKFGLLRVYRHPLGSTAWELPRGFIDKDESPREAALRELQEEAALSTSPAKLVSLGMLSPEPGVIAARVELFIALDCYRTADNRHSEFGHVGFGFFSSEEIKHLILRNEIQDPFTMVAYFKHALIAATQDFR